MELLTLVSDARDRSLSVHVASLGWWQFGSSQSGMRLTRAYSIDSGTSTTEAQEEAS